MPHSAVLWRPTVFSFVDELGEAGEDRDLSIADVELAWSIFVVLDRWLSAHPDKAEQSAELTRLLLTRMLGAR